MAHITRLGVVIAMATSLAGCFSPEDRRPGLRLRGQVMATAPSDWAFTNEHREIAIEVRTPYLLPRTPAGEGPPIRYWRAEPRSP